VNSFHIATLLTVLIFFTACASTEQTKEVERIELSYPTSHEVLYILNADSDSRSTRVEIPEELKNWKWENRAYSESGEPLDYYEVIHGESILSKYGACFNRHDNWAYDGENLIVYTTEENHQKLQIILGVIQDTVNLLQAQEEFDITIEKPKPIDPFKHH